MSCSESPIAALTVSSSAVKNRYNAKAYDQLPIRVPKGQKATIQAVNSPHKERILKALRKLEKEPPEGDIKSLVGRDGYRLRVGDYRILFDVLSRSR